ncbi:MAG: PilZ domain-containing protein [Deltaproteobacteria bacterium]|nr:PilZ domain-containing protein [Deltaproteobacteria bacterium]
MTKSANSRRKDIAAQLAETIENLSESQQKDLMKIARGWLDDQRKYTRKQYYMDIDYSDDHSIEHGMIHNISDRGVFVQPASAYPSGRSITMKFEHPHTPKNLELNGTIVWKNTVGMGIKFDQVMEGDPGN